MSKKYPSKGGKKNTAIPPRKPRSKTRAKKVYFRAGKQI